AVVSASSVVNAAPVVAAGAAGDGGSAGAANAGEAVNRPTQAAPASSEEIERDERRGAPSKELRIRCPPLESAGVPAATERRARDPRLHLVRGKSHATRSGPETGR